MCTGPKRWCMMKWLASMMKWVYEMYQSFRKVRSVQKLRLSFAVLIYDEMTVGWLGYGWNDCLWWNSFSQYFLGLWWNNCWMGTHSLHSPRFQSDWGTSHVLTIRMTLVVMGNFLYATSWTGFLKCATSRSPTDDFFTKKEAF